ncbi:hypothetical protein HDU98_007818, partial [Podochytrium sp. JEL0797]
QAHSLQTQKSNDPLLLLHTLHDLLVCAIDSFVATRNLDALRDVLAKKNVDDLMWNLAVHKRVDELRGFVSKVSESVLVAGSLDLMLPHSIKASKSKDAASLQTATSHLVSFLETATIFYRSLIQTIRVYGNSCCSVSTDSLQSSLPPNTPASESEFAALMRRVLFKSIVWLGDLERYKVTYSLAGGGSEKWDGVKEVYLWAVRVCPDQGKPQSQLAIVSTSCKNYLDALYWYTLSISNTTPLQIAKGNLSTFHDKITSRFALVSIDAIVAKSLNLLETLSTSVIQFHRNFLFHPDDSRLTVWSPATDAEVQSLMDVICYCVEELVGSSSSSSPRAQDSGDAAISDGETEDRDDASRRRRRVTKETTRVLQQIVVVLVAAFEELGVLFAIGDKPPPIRHRLRTLQCLTLSLLFRLSTSCLTHLHTTTNDSDSTAPAPLYNPMGLVCAWLYTQFLPITMDSGVSVGPLDTTRGGSAAAPVDAFSLFEKYTNANGVSDSMKSQYTNMSKFARALATLCTNLLPSSPSSLASQILPEDIYLLGFTPLKPFYPPRILSSSLRILDFTNNLRDTNWTPLRETRVIALAKRMSERSEVAWFEFIPSRNQFVVKDQESKRLDRLKTSQNLALHLLQTQITHLQQTIVPALPKTYIPFTSIYTHHLPFLKHLVTVPTARVVVAQSVVHDLDALKKGEEGVNRGAREAIRWLEERLRAGQEGLVSQRGGETVQDVSYLEEGSAPPPRWVKSFLGCCLFFRDKCEREGIERLEKLREAGVVESAGGGGEVWVVTDDDGVREECLRCGLGVKSVGEVRKEVGRGGGGGRSSGRA